MRNDTNDFLQFICDLEECLEYDKQNSTKARRLRKSKLDEYRLEILNKKAAGKSFQQIADYLANAHKVSCNRTTVFDFFVRCTSE